MIPDLEKWQPIIGLEVHGQLRTKSKMFCSCPNLFKAKPNTCICPVCSGQPGTLPIINQKAIELGIRVALSLNGCVQEKSVFSRKNYFYPDLPKGYQISQYESPFCIGGFVSIMTGGSTPKKIGLERIHFEEDAGKLIHEGQATRIDLNRAGVPLIEIVSKPEIETAEQAGHYLRKLRDILRYTDVCDGNMEEGSFRCDANVSVGFRKDQRLGTKVELKNINSFRHIEDALDYEIGRQIGLLEGGEKVVQQTRLWDVSKGVTEPMREKEAAHDYRYFPEPDLPLLIISDKWIEDVRKSLPELPDSKAERIKTEYGLPDQDVLALTASRELSDYFESVVKGGASPKAAANWVLNELMGKLKAADKTILDCPMSNANLSDLILRLDRAEITGKIAKDVFNEMFNSGDAPQQIIDSRGIVRINDVASLETIVLEVLKSHPKEVLQYRGGKGKLLGFFIGCVMSETKGQADPSLVNRILKKHLDEYH